MLPQTQCTRCGFDGCRPYADALAAGGSDINRCPPGGEAVIAQLAAADRPRRASRSTPRAATPGPLLVAVIDEAACIGCTLCIAACPVDAIIGAQKRMHAILPSLCSGCELCIAPCPVDCIAMVPADRAWTRADADAARVRHRARAARLAKRERIARRKAVAASAARAARDAAGRHRRRAGARARAARRVTRCAGDASARAHRTRSARRGRPRSC